MSTKAAATVSALKQAIKQKGDFPAVSHSLERILAAMKDSTCSDERMTNLVLNDFALSQKVLRLANTPMYAAFHPVTTVSMALYVLGIETVGHVAMGLKLIDNLGKAAESHQARTELSKTVLAGAIARRVATTVSGKDGEALAVATLMHSLGKMLVCFYLPDQFAAIEAAAPDFAHENVTAQAALGLSYEDLAALVATDWALPEQLQNTVHAPPPDAQTPANWRYAVTCYSRRYIAALSEGVSADVLCSLAAEYSNTIGASASDLQAQAQMAVALAIEEMGSDSSCFASRRRNPEPSVPTPAQRLTDGIAQLESFKGSIKSDQILNIATEVLWRSLGCARFMLFLRNRPAAQFKLVLGRGDGVTASVQNLTFDEAFTPDIFHFALTRNVSVHIQDAQDENIVTRIPSWLKETFAPARSLFLMPFSVGDQPCGLVYLDWGSQQQGTRVTEVQELLERFHKVVCDALATALWRTSGGPQRRQPSHRSAPAMWVQNQASQPAPLVQQKLVRLATR